MVQLTQNLKDGKMELLEVPHPAVGTNQLSIRNHYSVVSAGTEGRSVRDARANYIGKAKARPNEVKQVLNTVKTQGIVGTYKIIMDKLNAPSPLGYSCAGEVIQIGEGVTKFKVGDRVACGGQGAVHSEVVSALENLCVKIPENVDSKHAAFATIASIAMQGIRQADNRIGETCLIIGLGLLGQFTIQILNAAGVNTIGVDIVHDKVDLANANACNLALHRDAKGLEQQILDLTDGFGVDSVIITAASNSNDPVNLAGELCRKKGKVVSVGRVATNFNRDPYYYKELDLRMSCSYGPGRYDVRYEEKGIDYPIGYVRWTENRNMQAYINLLSMKKFNVNSLITHTFRFEDAFNAYDLIMNGSEPYVGILLEYDIKKDISTQFYFNSEKKNPLKKINVGFIGAGSFARKFLLPNIEKSVNKVAIATASGHNARHVANKFDFQYAFGDGDKLLEQADVNTVFITTRHNTHAKYVLKALKKGKNVFVEKPLCMTEEELFQIKKEYEKQNVHLMVGYNRRFSPFIQGILNAFGDNTKKTINCRLNVGYISPDHWTQDKDIGGGRIIGELCHFLDLAMFMAGAEPSKMTAFAMDDPLNLEDTVVVSIKYKNGSVANISYFTNGSEKLAKEYLEIYCNGSTAVIEDYKRLTIYNSRKKVMNIRQDKGHKQEMIEFVQAVEKGGKAPISFESIYWSTKMTFDVIRSIHESKMIIYE